MTPPANSCAVGWEGPCYATRPCTEHGCTETRCYCRTSDRLLSVRDAYRGHRLEALDAYDAGARGVSP